MGIVLGDILGKASSRMQSLLLPPADNEPGKQGLTLQMTSCDIRFHPDQPHALYATLKSTCGRRLRLRLLTAAGHGVDCGMADGIDAFEIDLTGLDPFADEATIREAIFAEAPRHWLSCVRRAPTRRPGPPAPHPSLSIPPEIRQQLLQAAAEAIDRSDASVPSPPVLRALWPENVKRPSAVPVAAACLFPQVFITPASWHESSLSLVGSGVVIVAARRTTIDVEVTLAPPSPVAEKLDRPRLMYRIAPGADGQPVFLACDWQGVQEWNAKLQQYAQINALANAYSDQDSVLDQLCEYSILKRPDTLGPLDECWGMHRHVWQAYLWRYHLSVAGSISLTHSAIERRLPRQVGFSAASSLRALNVSEGSVSFFHQVGIKPHRAGSSLRPCSRLWTTTGTVWVGATL